MLPHCCIYSSMNKASGCNEGSLGDILGHRDCESLRVLSSSSGFAFRCAGSASPQRLAVDSSGCENWEPERRSDTVCCGGQGWHQLYWSAQLSSISAKLLEAYSGKQHLCLHRPTCQRGKGLASQNSIGGLVQRDRERAARSRHFQVQLRPMGPLLWRRQAAY